MSTVDTTQTTNTSVEIENIDDFLPLPGAESVVTTDDGEEEAAKTIFSKPEPADLTFLDDDSDDSEDGDKKKVTKAEVDSALQELDDQLAEEEEADGTNKAGRKKIDKS